VLARQHSALLFPAAVLSPAETWRCETQQALLFFCNAAGVKHFDLASEWLLTFKLLRNSSSSSSSKSSRSLCIRADYGT
jgi:hypothetical protein